MYHIAAFYRFIPIENLDSLRQWLLDTMRAHNVRGTILLAHEGINATIAAEQPMLSAFLQIMESDPLFNAMPCKFSTSDLPPFQRSKVKIKKEIVTLGVGNLDVHNQRGEYISPEAWAEFIRRPDVVTIDTRNRYETGIGTFEGAIDPRTRNFREFPEWAQNWIQDKNPKDMKVAMFCTGGIRCEKSTAYMKSLGIEQVYHLEGGILNYLEKTENRDRAWNGECFIFDERVSLDDHLHATGTAWCIECGSPVQFAMMAPQNQKEPRCAAHITS